MTTLAPRLPGIYFESEVVAPRDALPRMDIAAFVGFAASGPLHVPVAIEDVQRFRELFGEDPELAWDEDRGRVVRAYLGDAVQSFFRSGGNRCWVVRVADESVSVTLDFEVPGVTGTDGSAVVALARSPGMWAADFELGTVLRRERFVPARDPSAGGPFEVETDDYRLELAPTTTAIENGDLLELVFADLGVVLLLFVESGEKSDGRLTLRVPRRSTGAGDPLRAHGFLAPGGSPHFAAEPPLGAENDRLEALAPDDLDLFLVSGSPAVMPDAVHRLTFDMLAWRGSRIDRRMERLAFSPDHPRYWGALPDDVDLFRSAEGERLSRRTPEQDRLRSDASTPRFPFAGPEGVDSHHLPLGMATTENRESAVETVAPDGTRLELDGLSQLDDALFLDRDLVGSTAVTLLSTAEHERYGPDPRSLRGVHALFAVDEISMVTVPDAVHRSWGRSLPPAPDRLAAPWLHPVSGLDNLGLATVTWTAVPEADGYRLEIDLDGAFRNPTVINTDGDVSARFAPRRDCPTTFRFRVRAERETETSPWSNGRAAVLPVDPFDDCDRPPPGVASLILDAVDLGSPDGGTALEWRYEDPLADDPDDAFELEQAFEPGFEGPFAIAPTAEGFDAVERRYVLEAFAETSRFYRVRVVRDGEAGVWSNVVRVDPDLRDGWALRPIAEYEPGALLAIHRALIRFCAARADAVALLTMPRHYRPTDVVEHVGDLLPDDDGGAGSTRRTGTLNVANLTSGEHKAPGYAAVYHPWVARATSEHDRAAGDTPPVRWTPPDGEAAGSIAARTRRLGAWIAPANEPIPGVLAVDPATDAADWSRLTAARINVLVREPRGFVILNSDTLSRTEDLRPLSVRRLLILLRRLAIREGATFVFEPNDFDFRSLVRQRFERVLSGMYLRGAFAGSTPAAGFRVVVDDSNNPPTGIDRGRLVVDLRVAPSRPFHYLNVRLVQTGPERLTLSET